jgi:hypothetical protein
LQVVQSILIDDPFRSVHLQEIEILTDSLEEIQIAPNALARFEFTSQGKLFTLLV